MNKNEIVFYKGNEATSQLHYEIPKELFISSLYKDTLNSDSKILYAFLLDRLSLSQLNNWVDDKNRVYLIFTRKEVQEKLGLSEKTVTKAFKQLENVNLILEKRQGQGMPNLIYVAKIQYEEKADTENIQVLNRKIYGSGKVKTTVQEPENLRAINTNNINTNLINTESITLNSDDETTLKEIKYKCKLNEFTKEEQAILEEVIDSLYYKDKLKVGNVIVDHIKILSKLELITKENLVQLLDILTATPNIQNTKKYLITCLYNNLGSMYKPKKNIYKFDERSYSEEFYNGLYANQC